MHLARGNEIKGKLEISKKNIFWGKSFFCLKENVRQYFAGVWRKVRCVFAVVERKVRRVFAVLLCNSKKISSFAY